jgi:tetratricopeptide (TPR) repeat protein
MSTVELELMIWPAGSAYRVKARCTPPGTDTQTSDSALVQIDQARLLALAHNPVAYGRALGELVLAGPIGGILGIARAIAERDEVSLRLRLDLDPDADALHSLRWETLRDPARPDQPLLTTGTQVVFSRYLSSSAWQPVRVPPLEELRALAVLSSPLDLPDFGLTPLDLEIERALVTASFGQIPVTVLGRGAANLDTITQHLGDGYDIIYLLAHGRAGDGDTLIYLEDADGLTAPTLGSVLATRIAELERRPRLIILGSCETAGDVARLGPLLAQKGVPAVVATQDKITIATLRRFLPECLRLLQQDGRIDLAVAQARGLVRDRADFWMPVLFLRLLSGRLWGEPVIESETPQKPEELLASLPLDCVPEPQNLPTPHRMPLRPNPLFVGRDDELRTLARLLREGGTVAITTGIGGMGKTQLAAELAHRYGAFFAGGVFWLSCAEPAGIPGEVVACGRLLDLPLDGKAQEVQVQLTRATWEERLPRLLIFDNCEEEATLRQWLPTSGGARVLVTSRRASWSATLKVQPVPLAMLGRGASVALLQGLAPRLTIEEAGQVAEALGDLPLALHLAGSYLARYRLPVADYLARLASVPLQHPSLTGRGVEDMPTPREPHVERAFALSLARLDASNSTDDLARQLLARAACFAPGEPFQRVWLEATVTPEGDDEAQMLARTDAVERLLTLGLLEQTGAETLRQHQLLVAYAAQALPDGAALLAVERIIGSEAGKANNTGVPAAMQPVLPHLRHLVQRIGQREDEQGAQLFNDLGYYLNLMGSYDEARPLLERALAIRERVLGADHPDTAWSLSNLASLLRAQGVYGEARPLLERALAIREQVLRPDHPDVAQSLNSLGELLRMQRAYGEAGSLLERALAIRERVLGDNHPKTAQSLSSLASFSQDRQVYDRALSYYHRALTIYTRALGPDHPDTCTCRSNRRSCIAAAQLGPLSSASDGQRDQVLAQARTTTEAALADPAADRHALATAIEARARWAEEGQSEDSPELALAAELRALIIQLGVTPDDPDAL